MAISAETTLNQSACLVPPATDPIAEYHPPAWLQPDLETRSIVDYSPSEIVRRHSAAWSGMHVETVQVVRHTPFEYGFRAPCHLLIAAELADRYDGETFVEGLPRSTLSNFTRKLTFVPAGHDFRGSQTPRTLTRATYFYIDPRGPLADPALRFGEIEFKPRLFFYDRGLWETALKLKALVENPGQPWRPCVLAAKAGGRLYRGACRRRHPAGDAGRTGAAKPLPFLPVVQALFRHAAAQISRQSPNRTSQAAIGRSQAVHHRDRARDRLQRNQHVHRRVSQADRPNPEPLSSQSRLKNSGRARDCCFQPVLHGVAGCLIASAQVLRRDSIANSPFAPISQSIE